MCDHLDAEILYYVCTMDECKLIDLFNLFCETISPIDLFAHTQKKW